MLDEANRRIGRTTSQIAALPFGGVFVCQTETLARHLSSITDRKDITFVGRTWFSRHAWRGQTFNAIELDHATTLNDEEWAEYVIVRSQVRP